MNLPIYTQPKLSLAAQPLTPSPSSGPQTLANNYFTNTSHASFTDPSPHDSSFNQTSSAGEGLMLNTSTCAYPTPGYPLSPDPCIPSPVAATTAPGVAWPTRSLPVDFDPNPAVSAPTWYRAITPPPGESHSAAPLSVPIAGQMPDGVPPAPGQDYSHSFTHYPSEMPGFAHGYAEPRTWKHVMSLQHNQMPGMEPQHTSPQYVPGFYVSQEHLTQMAPGVGY